MPRTLSTNTMAELLSRAPSVWDSYDPRIDYAEPEAPKPADPTETPTKHLNFVVEVRIMEQLANGAITFVINDPDDVQAVRDLVMRKAG